MPASELIQPQTAVQDWKNKNIGLLGVTPGATPDPFRTQVPNQTAFPQSGPTAQSYQAGLVDTANQEQQAHLRLMDTIQRRQQTLRAQQGLGQTGASTRAITAAGMGSAGGWGGAWGMQKNAAAALQQLSSAYQARWGSPLVVNSGGRTYAQQAAAYAAYRAGHGNLAAPPGHSVHETGRAVDLGGAIMNQYSAQHRWLEQVAAQYGFAWTGRTFSQIEPWHWEYTGR